MSLPLTNKTGNFMQPKAIQDLAVDELFERLNIGGNNTSLGIAANVLKEEQVDGKTLLELDEDTINSLLLKVGPRAALKLFIKTARDSLNSSQIITIPVPKEPKKISTQKTDGTDSTTKFTQKVIPNPSGNGFKVDIEPQIITQYEPSSYGNFSVQLFDGEGNVISSTLIEVRPETSVQLPTRVSITDNQGNSMPGCNSLLVQLISKGNGLSKEIEKFKAVTNKDGQFELPSDLDDGTYILRVFPNKSGIAAKEVTFVVALGLRNSFSKFGLNTLNRAYSDLAGISSFQGEALDSESNSKGRSLIRPGGLKGTKMAVLQLYSMSIQNFISAISTSGIQVDIVDSLSNIELSSYCQLWIISTHYKVLGATDVDKIVKFYEQGNGVYIWGDNEPYYVDANIVGKRLFNASMSGNLPGQRKVNKTVKHGLAGFLAHPVFTGLSTLYEGITIATIDISESPPSVKPIMYGSANNLVTVNSQDGNKRAMMDGGFTRLMDDYWDTAGTHTFVCNCVGWLANLENPRPSISCLN
jgi:hypothetical protein